MLSTLGASSNRVVSNNSLSYLQVGGAFVVHLHWCSPIRTADRCLARCGACSVPMLQELMFCMPRLQPGLYGCALHQNRSPRSCYPALGSNATWAPAWVSALLFAPTYQLYHWQYQPSCILSNLCIPLTGAGLTNNEYLGPAYSDPGDLAGTPLASPEAPEPNAARGIGIYLLEAFQVPIGNKWRCAVLSVNDTVFMLIVWRYSRLAWHKSQHQAIVGPPQAVQLHKRTALPLH